MAEKPAVAVDVAGLTVCYGDHEAVSDVSLSISRGEVFALLGTNGAGKTTTLETIQGYRTPTAGTVRVLGLDPHDPADGAALRTATGFMMQEGGLIAELTAAETLQYWTPLMSRPDDPDRLLDVVGLTHRADIRVDQLSGGEKRRLDLALTIWGNPELVVLDEPTTGLDAASRNTLWDVVRDLTERGTTVILTTHYLEEAQTLSDSAAIMNAGTIALSGDMETLLAERPSTVAAEVPTRFASGFVADHPSWQATQLPDGRSQVRCTPADSAAATALLLNETASAGGAVTNLEVTRARLEDIFLQISQGSAEGPSTNIPSPVDDSEVSV